MRGSWMEALVLGSCHVTSCIWSRKAQLGSCGTKKLWYGDLMRVQVSEAHFQLTASVLSLSLRCESSKVAFSRRFLS